MLSAAPLGAGPVMPGDADRRAVARLAERMAALRPRPKAPGTQVRGTLSESRGDFVPWLVGTPAEDTGAVSMMSGSSNRLLHLSTLDDLPDTAGRRVLVRATLDLPLGRVPDAPVAVRRAKALQSSLQWLTGRGATVTVCGDAGGSGPEAEAVRFSSVRRTLEELSPGVLVADDSAGGGPSAEDRAVIEKLVGSHDLFVNDSFQWSYLPLPSLVLPPERLPSAIGFTVEQNLEAIVPLLHSPRRLFVAALGGDRSVLRLHGLEGLVLRADSVVVGGGIALPLLQAIGKQPHDGVAPEFLAECRRVHGIAERVGHRIQLPLDLVWERDDGTVEVVEAGKRLDGRVVDIGPRSRLRFAEIVTGASTLLWSGSLGQVEDRRFTAGTRDVAAALAVPETVVLGGDALLAMLDTEGRVPAAARVLTATDAALELLKNGDLPAFIALRRLPHPP
jgi:phosphoglycerate kinase